MITYCTFVIGVLLFILSMVQWNLHATDGWIGETWDSEIQEKLYYIIAPISVLCMLLTLIFGILGL